MIETSSEFVSTAHPDRLADLLAAKVIQDIQAINGPNSHAAIEVFLTHDAVIFSGEATTTLEITDKYLRKVTVDCFERAGYTHNCRKYWTEEQMVLPEDLEIVNNIKPQSPDIALGTTDLGEESGYNDQGIFYSSADCTTSNHIGTAHYIATLIGEYLHSLSRASFEDNSNFALGPDIKVVVTTSLIDDLNYNEVTAITIAQSHSSGISVNELRPKLKKQVERLLEKNNICIAYDCKWVINGTGRFVVCGQVSDTSMTGRKLAVNHPSAGPYYACKMQGGGSMIKCSHASDLILPLAARFIANVIVEADLSTYAIVGCSGAIGQNTLQSLFIKGDKEFEEVREKVIKFFINKIDWSPIALAKQFKFFSKEFDFSEVVKNNFFGHPECQPWENSAFLRPYRNQLLDFIQSSNAR